MNYNRNNYKALTTLKNRNSKFTDDLENIIKSPIMSLENRVEKIVGSKVNRVVYTEKNKLLDKISHHISLPLDFEKNFDIVIPEEVQSKIIKKYDIDEKNRNVKYVGAIQPILRYLIELDEEKFINMFGNRDNIKYLINALKREGKSNKFIDKDRYTSNMVSLKNLFQNECTNFPDRIMYFKKMKRSKTFLLCFVCVNTSLFEEKMFLDDSTTKLYNFEMYWFGEDRKKYFNNFAEFILQDELFKLKLHDLRKEYQKNKAQKDNKTFVFNYRNQFDDRNFKLIKEKNAKTFNATIINSDILAGLKSALSDFLNNTSVYAKYGVSHNLGIMLYGEPGTGKSTIAKAIVKEISDMVFTISNISGYGVYYPDISKAEWIDDLTNIISGSPTYSRIEQFSNNIGLPPQIFGTDDYEEIPTSPADNQTINIIILEDIDIIIGANRKDAKTLDDRQRLSNLLRLLDGQILPSNCIFIATTNRYDDLESEFDEALTRDGRFDVKCYIGNFDREMSSKMCDYFDIDINDLEAYTDIEYPIRPSKLQNKCVNFIFSKLKTEKKELGKDTVITEEGTVKDVVENN